MQYQLILGDVEFINGKLECKQTLLREYESTSDEHLCEICELPTVLVSELLVTSDDTRMCLNRKCPNFRVEKEQ